MSLSKDSLQHLPAAPARAKATAPAASAVRAPKKSTYQVLQALPDSATPWQQDSAVQAYFRPGLDNRYTERPDTLGLPGQRADSTQMPYPKEAWKDPAALHKAMSAGMPADTLAQMSQEYQQGLMGDPVAAMPGSDSLLACILIGCFMLMVMAYSRSRTFMIKQVRSFFYTAKARTTQLAEQPSEVWYQALLTLIALIITGVAVYCGLSYYNTGYQTAATQHAMMGTCLMAVMTWFAVRSLLMCGVNWVFFVRKKNLQWLRSSLLLAGCAGAAMLPVLLLYVYGPLSWEICSIYLLFVVILAEIMLIYKSFVTFFDRVGDFFQIILYFCALEMMPLAGLAGFIALYQENLRINF